MGIIFAGQLYVDSVSPCLQSHGNLRVALSIHALYEDVYTFAYIVILAMFNILIYFIVGLNTAIQTASQLYTHTIVS